MGWRAKGLQELGCHMQGPGFSLHLSCNRGRTPVKQFGDSFKHPVQPGLFKRAELGSSKGQAALASLCFTPHPQLIPFTHPKFCLSSCNHFTPFPAHQGALRSLGSNALPTPGSLGCSEQLPAFRLIEVFWSSGNSMHHEHSKTSFCLQSNTHHTPT